MAYRLGVDVGGTFTDLFLVDANGNEIALGCMQKKPVSAAEERKRIAPTAWRTEQCRAYLNPYLPIGPGRLLCGHSLT